MATTYTFFLHLRAAKAWLSLTPQQREAFTENELGPIVQQHAATSISFYDAEAFTAKCSDITMFETTSLMGYSSLMNKLRDTKLFTVPYFEVIDIFPAIKSDYI